MTYTPTNNTVPTYGEESQSVRDYQHSLNTKWGNTAGWTPLKEDGMYGPLTQQGSQFSPSSNLITTSSSSRKTFAENSSGLASALAKLSGGPTVADPNAQEDTIENHASDPIISGLTALQSSSDTATKALIDSTRAAYQNSMNKTNSQFENYKRGLQGLGIEHNEAQATPDLLAGHIQQAANEQMDKINSLKAEESKLLIDAQTAKEGQDFKTLQAKMDRLKEIKTEKADAIKNMYDTLSSTSKAASIEAHDIYDTMQSLNDNDKQAFISAVAAKYKIPVMSLVTALNDEKTARSSGYISNTSSKKTKSASGGSSTKMSREQILLGENKLNDSRGEDTYVDPNVYKAAFDDWKGTTKEFLLAYPPKDYVNPANKWLPKFLLPPKAKSGRTV